MSNSNSSAAIEQNGLLAAVFLRELAELMKKHNASIELEHNWRNEYDSETELWFKVNDVYLNDYFTTTSKREIKSDEIFERLSNGGER